MLQVVYNPELFVKQAKSLLRKKKKVYINFSEAYADPKVIDFLDIDKINVPSLEYMYMYRQSKRNGEIGISSRAKHETIHQYIYGLYNHDFESDSKIELQLIDIANSEILVPKGVDLEFQYNEETELLYFQRKYKRCIYNLEKKMPSALRKFDCLEEATKIFSFVYIHISPSVLDRYNYVYLENKIMSLEKNKIKLIVPKYNVNNKDEHEIFISKLESKKFDIEIIESNSYEQYLV